MINDYIIGLLTADGNTRKASKNSYSTTIELTDKQILEDIANEYGRSLNYRKRVIANKEREFWSVTFNTSHLGEVAPSLVKDRPNIYEYYKKCNKLDFIRGLFDGDGCICITGKRKNGMISFSINSSSVDIYKIIEDFCKEFSISKSDYFDKRGKGSWYITFNKKEDVLKFYNLIYSNNPKLYLKRKYNKFLELGFPNLVTD